MSEKEFKVFEENCQYLGMKYLLKEYSGLIQQAGKTGIGYWEFLKDIIMQEAAHKKERSIRYRIQESRLPKPYKLLSDFNFTFQPKLNKSLIMDLSTMNFINRKLSVLFIGNPGTGYV
jgi:DNA replication protein DnaC